MQTGPHTHDVQRFKLARLLGSTAAMHACTVRDPARFIAGAQGGRARTVQPGTTDTVPPPSPPAETEPPNRGASASEPPAQKSKSVLS